MTRASAPGYDLFKLLVTIILIAILLLMLLRGCATTSASLSPTENAGPAAPTQEAGAAVATETKAAPAPAESSTPLSASPTSEALSTATVSPTDTPDSAEPTATVAPATSSTVTSTPSTNATTPAASSGGSADCNTSVPSRLRVGQEAQVAQRLNMRSDASISAPILQTNPTNARLEIIGGPVCTPVGESAYLWWQIRLADGTEGWSAEAELNEPSYLLAPVP